MWAIRGIGCLLLLAAVVCVSLIWANWHTALLGGRDLKPLALPAAFFCLLGLGLILRRKSAALIVIFGSVAWASWLLIGSLRLVPMPWLVVNLAVAIVVLVPAGVIVKKWQDLAGW